MLVVANIHGEDMYEWQTCTMVTVVTQGCCQLFLQSSSVSETMFPVLDNSAVQKHWAFVGMYERQTCLGETVVTQGCSQLFLQSSTEPATMFPVLDNCTVQSVGHLQTCMKGKLAQV